MKIYNTHNPKHTFWDKVYWNIKLNLYDLKMALWWRPFGRPLWAWRHKWIHQNHLKWLYDRKVYQLKMAHHNRVSNRRMAKTLLAGKAYHIWGLGGLYPKGIKMKYITLSPTIHD